MTKALFSIAKTADAMRDVSLRPHRAAADMGVVLRTVSIAMLVEPVFLAGNEPMADARTYTAIDGRNFACPTLRIGRRGGAFPGPDVMFIREIDGTTFLHVVIEQSLPEGTPEGTQTLGTPVGPPRIDWNGGSLTLPDPTPVEGADPGTVELRILAPLEPDHVAMLVQAMTDPAANCEFVMVFGASYRVRATPPGNRPELQLPPWRKPVPFPRIPINPDRILRPLDGGPVLQPLAMRDMRITPARGVESGTLQMLDSGFVSKSAVISPDLLDRWIDRKLIDIPDLRRIPFEAEESAGTISFPRRLPFFFDRTLDQNLPVFRAISGAATLPSDWQDSEWGTLCPAEFVNTVYLLPHEFRLAYDAARGLPHMLPIQYAADDGTRRLRVVLRTEPWFDPGRVAGLQTALSRQSGGAYIHPRIIAGGAVGARLRLGTIFPERIAVAEDAEADGVEIDVISPFDLTLDLSEEYYALLVTVLTGPVGLTGWVEVTLGPAADGGTPAQRRIPLSLTFGRLGLLPLTESVATAAINPERVDITNRAAQPVTIGGAAASLLLLDENALLPAAVLAARPAEAFPLLLDAGGSATLTFAPVSAPEGAVWNAVVPVLTGITVAVDPDAALRAIHALAPPSTFGWQLRLLSPQLQAATQPDPMLAVEIRMTRDGGNPVQATLMAGQAERVVTFPRHLDDLIGNGAAADGFLRLSVTARGVWATGFGAWSAPADHVGDTLFVFVPPRDGDAG